MHSESGYTALHRFLGGNWAGIAMMLVLVVTLQFTPSNVIGLPNLIIHTVMTLTLAALILRTDTPLSKALQTPFISRIGVISYGIYLYHMIAKDFTVRVFGRLGIENEWLLLLAYSAVSFVVAEISFRTLEAYFKRFRPAD